MSRCSVCGNPKRTQIDNQLLSGVFKRHIIKKFGVTRDALANHWKYHVDRDGHKAGVPEPTPEALELPPDKLSDHLAMTAPLGVCKAAGLPPGATYGQCLRESLLRSAIGGDTSAAKELLERLEGLAPKEPPRPVEVRIKYDDRFKRLSKSTPEEYCAQQWEYYLSERLRCTDPALKAKWDWLPARVRAELWDTIIEGLKSIPENVNELLEKSNGSVQ
jgi:hypothetical protein